MRVKTDWRCGRVTRRRLAFMIVMAVLALAASSLFGS